MHFTKFLALFIASAAAVAIPEPEAFDLEERADSPCVVGATPYCCKEQVLATSTTFQGIGIGCLSGAVAFNTCPKGDVKLCCEALVTCTSIDGVGCIPYNCKNRT